MNPKKTVFAVTEGKLMVFIVSKYGMIIDLEISESIAKIGLISSNKSMQYFLGNIILSGELYQSLHKLLGHSKI